MEYKDLENWQEKKGFTKPKNKLNIYYSPLSYAKTTELVMAHPVEIGWNMVMTPYKDGYKVHDILVYPQKVSAAHISVDVANWGLWKATLNDFAEQNLNGHGHSHVNMSVYESIIDVNQQYGEVQNKKGYYFFQIWNKHGEINSFFYDIDNRIYYKSSDIEMIIEEVDEFIAQSFRMVQSKPKNQYEEGEGFESEQVV